MKRVLLAYFLIMAAALQSYGSDFKDTSHGNKVEFTFTGCSAKVIKGDKCWLKDWDGSYSKDSSDDAPWTYGSSSFYFDEQNFFYKYSRKFHNYLLLGLKTTSCSVSCYGYHDNTCPEADVVCDLFFRDGVYWGNDSSVVKIYVPEDTCDHPGISGCGIKSMTLSVDGEDQFFEKFPDDGCFEVPLSGDGMHAVSVTLFDELGNKSEENCKVIMIENKAPYISTDEYSQKTEWVQNNAELGASADDYGSGLDCTSWRISFDDGKTWNDLDSSFVNEKSCRYIAGEGVSDVRFSVSDNAGNVAVSDAVSVRIDMTPPEIYCGAIEGKSWINVKSFSFHAKDETSGVDEKSYGYVLDGKKHSGNVLTDLKEGLHSVSFFASDAGGNLASTEAKEFGVDSTACAVEVFPETLNCGTYVPVYSDLLSGINSSSVKYRFGDGQWIFGRIVELCEGYNDLELSVTDNAGNETVKKGRILLDSLPPEITFGFPECTNESDVKLKDFFVRDDHASKLKVHYVLTGNEKKSIENFSDPCVSLDSLYEGKNFIEVYADDGNGNSSVVRKEFIYDKTCPAVNEIFLFSGKDSVEDGGYASPFESLCFTVDAADESADGFSDSLTGFYYSLNGSDLKFASKKSIVSIEAEEGLNILKVKAVDAAGNESETKVFKFRVDCEKPKKPSVTSECFIFADRIERSSRAKSGSFDVKAFSSDGSICGDIVWELFTCMLKNEGSVDEFSLSAVAGAAGKIENFNGIGTINLSDVEDNAENQFYCLKVYVSGKNKIQSECTYYTFRIDTKPVESFDVIFESHADELKWYSSSNVLCRYVRGTDASGIALVEYSFDEKTWTEIYADDDLRFSVHVPDGKNKVYFRCMDKAGNHTTVSKSVNVDSVSPYFDDDFKLDCLLLENKKASLEWGAVSDDLSGVESHLIFIRDLLEGAEKILHLEASAKGTEISELEDGRDYSIRFASYDKAGNMVEKSIVVLQSGNAKIPFSLREEFKNIVFSVNAEFDSEKNIAKLCPASLMGFSNCSMKIEEGELYEDGRVSRAKSEKKKSGLYSVKISDVDFYFEWAEFERENGLVLKNCFYEIKSTGERVCLDSLYAGFPDDYSLNGLSQEKDFSDLSVGAAKISGIEQYFLSDSKIHPQGKLHFSFDGKKTYDSLSIRFDLDGKKFYASILPGQELVLSNGAVLLLEDSFFYQTKLFVKKSFMDFECEEKKYRLLIENFSYDAADGKYYTDECRIKCFDSENNELDSVESSFMNFFVKDIYLSEDGYLKCKGTFKNGSVEAFILDDVFIDNNGISFDEASLNELDMELFGFSLKVVEGGFLVLDGETSLKIKSGFINILGKKFSVDGLVVSLERKDGVIKKGLSNDAANINCEYGSYVEVSNLQITSDGVFASVNVPLPDGSGKIAFENGKIFNDGSFVCRNENEKSYSFFGYGVSALLTEFDGKTLSLSDGFIDVSDESFCLNEKKVSSISFSRLALTYDSMQEISPLDVDGINYKRDGWEFSFSKLYFGFGGFSGSAKADGVLCELSGSFENLIFNKGSFSSDRHNDSSGVMNVFYGERAISLPECQFVIKDGELALSCEKPVFEFVDASGKKKISFGKTFVYSDGRFYGSLGNQENLLVESVNGLKLQATKAKLSGNDLLFCGTLKIEPLKAEVNVDDFEIYLDENFSLLTSKKISKIEYVYAGWKVQGKNAYFKKNGDFKVTENSVEFRSNVLELGELLFNENFELKKDFIIEQNRNFDLFGSTSYLSCTIFGPNGLSGAMYYKFPDYLKGGKFFLSDVKFFPDGSFSSKDFVEDAKITNDNVNADFKRVTVGDSKLKIEGFSMESKGDDKFAIEIPESYITDKGQFVVENKLIPPFEIWGCTFIVKELSLSENGTGFNGSVVLSEKAPGVLSNKKIQLNNFFMDWLGDIKSFEICDEGETEIPLFGSWRLRFNGLKIIYVDGCPYIVFKESRIVFPGQFNFCEALCIDDVKINLRTMDFSFEKIRLALNSKFNIGGLDFKLSEIYFSQNHNVGLKCSVDFSDESFPEFLRSAGGVSADFEITPEGEVAVFKIILKDLNGKILNDVDALRIEDGSVSFIREKGRYIADVNGKLFFSECVEGSFNDMKLDIQSFKFDLSSLLLVELTAEGRCLNASIGSVKFKDVYASVEWGQGKEKLIALSGNIILPESLPGGLSGTVVSLNDFKIGAGGEILSLDASVLMDKDLRIGKGVVLDKVKLSVLYKDKNPTFDVNGRFELDKEIYDFGPGGISGYINLVFSENGLESVQADSEIKDMVLFDALQVENFRMIASVLDGDLTFDFFGSAYFIDGKNVPDGISGSRFEIKKFQIDMSGKVIDMEIKGTTKNFTVFDCVEIGSPSAEIILNNDAFMISFGGSVKLLSEKIPENIRNAEFWISKMILSFDGEVVDFDLKIDSSVKFTILSGLDVYVDSLQINHRGFGCQTRAVMNFKGPMKETEIKLSNFFMKWNGTISALEADLATTDIEIAGFKGSIRNLCFVKDASCRDGFFIKLEECKLCLPENAGDKGGLYFALKNAEFRDGDFTGEFEAPDFTINIADFILSLEGPEIDFEDNEIKFQRVYMHLPKLLGSVALNMYGVKISSSDGLQINGGIIYIPDFTIGNNIGFRNVGVDFVCKGDKYSVTGTGAVSIPGTGELEAKLTFCDTCDMYPLGLQQAYFSFEVAAGKGLPLGTTGLYLTGIRGGLAYGKPDEVPADYRKFFEKDGCRIQLGLTAADQTGGSVMKIKPDTWIDVWNHSWVFDGSATVLKGTLDINANAMASFSKYGFTTEMKFRINFVEGEMQFFVFKKDGSVKFSGTASIGIVIRKGKIFKKKMPWKIPDICIPWSDVKIGEIDSEFGCFTNESVGFKAYISLLGYHLGVFVSNKGVDLGNVSGYSILKPVYDDREMMVVNYAEEGHEAPVTEDKVFEIPDKLQGVVFACSYFEIKPDLKFISPDGKVYTEESDGVDAVYGKDCFYVSIPSPKCGFWKYEADGYDFSLCGIEAVFIGEVPEVKITDAVLNGEDLFVEGHASETGKKVSVYAKSRECGFETETGSLYVDSNGNFSGKIHCDMLYEGTYSIIVRLESDSDFGSAKDIFEKDVELIRNQCILSVPEGLRAAVQNEVISVKWKNIDRAKACGFELMVNKDGKETIYDAGNSLEFVLVNSEFDFFSVQIRSYGSRGEKSEWSQPVVLKEKSDEDSDFSFAVSSVQNTEIIKDHYASFVIDVETDPKKYDEALRFIQVEFIDLPEHIEAVMENEAEVKNGKASLTCHAFADKKCIEGLHELKCRISYWGKEDCFVDYVHVLNVAAEKLHIEALSEASICPENDNEITVFGTGFNDGTRYFLDGRELCVVQDDYSSSCQKTVLIPGHKAEGESILAAVGSNSQISEVTIENRKAGYLVYPRINSLVLKKGTRGYYPLRIVRSPDFYGNIEMFLSDCSSGLSVSVPYVGSGSNVEISVFADRECSTGEKKIFIAYEDEKCVELNVLVADDSYFEPSIKQVVPYSVLPGEKVTVYGNNFDSNSKLIFNGMEIPVDSCSDTKIEFTVPLNSGDWTFYIETPLGRSKVQKLNVKKEREGMSLDDLFENGEEFVLSKRKSIFDRECPENMCWKRNELEMNKCCSGSLKNVEPLEFDWLEHKAGEGTNVLLARDLIFIADKFAVSAYSADGNILWEKEFNHKIQTAAVYGSRLYVLSVDGCLYSVRVPDFYEEVVLDEVLGITGNCNFLLVKNDSSTRVYSSTEIDFLGDLPVFDYDSEKTVWRENDVYFWKERIMYSLLDGSVFFRSKTLIDDVHATENGFEVKTGLDSVCLDSAGNEI